MVPLRERGMDGLLLFGSPNLTYLTGYEFGKSERPSAILIPVGAEPAVIVPNLELQRYREQDGWIQDLRGWEEHEPWEFLARTLREKGMTGRIGISDDAPWGWIQES